VKICDDTCIAKMISIAIENEEESGLVMREEGKAAAMSIHIG
jgi:hypothetical protein